MVRLVSSFLRGLFLVEVILVIFKPGEKQFHCTKCGKTLGQWELQSGFDLAKKAAIVVCPNCFGEVIPVEDGLIVAGQRGQPCSQKAVSIS
jgi:DNA-directed RNA polymerase subunit RPC12/RpoP